MCSAACLFRLSTGSLSLNSDSGSFTPTTGSCACSAKPAGHTATSEATRTNVRIFIGGFYSKLNYCMNGASLLVAALENEGVERIFGVPGEENLDLLEALHRSSIDLVVTRHEQPAAFMAATY